MLTDAQCRNAICPPDKKRMRLTDALGLRQAVKAVLFHRRVDASFPRTARNDTMRTFEQTMRNLTRSGGDGQERSDGNY